MRIKKRINALVGAAALLVSTQWASGIVVTSTLDPTTLQNALINAGSGLVVNSITVSGQSSGGALSAGTYTNASGTYGIGSGVVISSGNVADYGDGSNIESQNTTGFGAAASAAQEALLDPITGGFLDHNDVTQIDINFDLEAGFHTVFFNVVFGSEEFNEFVDSSFIDAFGLYVNGVNIAEVAGDPVNIDHPDMGFFPGTELDGILANISGNPGPLVHTFSLFIGDGATNNTLTFIIADSDDFLLDSTAYISQLGGTPPPPPGVVPEPVTASLGILSAAGLFLATHRRRNA